MPWREIDYGRRRTSSDRSRGRTGSGRAAGSDSPRYRHLSRLAAAHHGGPAEFHGAGPVAGREPHHGGDLAARSPRGYAQAGRPLPDRHGLRDAQGHPHSQGQPAAVLRRHRAGPHARVHFHRPVPARPRGTAARRGARHDERGRSAAAERDRPVPADRGGVAQPLRRSFGKRVSHRRAGETGGFRRRQPALALPSRAPATAGTGRRAGAPGHDPPPSHARAGTARPAQPDSVPGAGAAFPEPAGVLPARAVEGHPEGTGRRRRLAARARRPARQARSRRA